MPTGSNIRHRRLLSIRSVRLLPVTLGQGANRSSDRSKFEPNTAIADKQSYLRAHILYLSTHDRCELFRCCALSAPCSLRRSSRNQASSPSVSLGLGISAGGFATGLSFVSSMVPRHSKTLRLR